ncbi:hypothetical protein MHYP_G00355780 [Metynnis hypsauchen]
MQTLGLLGRPYIYAHLWDARFSPKLPPASLRREQKGGGFVIWDASFKTALMRASSGLRIETRPLPAVWRGIVGKRRRLGRAIFVGVEIPAVSLE